MTQEAGTRMAGTAFLLNGAVAGPASEQWKGFNLLPGSNYDTDLIMFVIQSRLDPTVLCE